MRYRPRNDADSISALTVKEASFYSIWSASILIHPLDRASGISWRYHGVAEHSYVSPDRCYMLLSFARHAMLLDGDFAGCGVSRWDPACL